MPCGVIGPKRTNFDEMAFSDSLCLLGIAIPVIVVQL